MTDRHRTDNPAAGDRPDPDPDRTQRDPRIQEAIDRCVGRWPTTDPDRQGGRP